MTVPGAGARRVVLTPGAGPIMLTNYAPGDQALLIINSDVHAGEVYVGDSSLTTGNGVPIDPGTALPWTTPGELWAIADPAAAAPITVILTAAVAGWTPSPAAIAAAVAADLLATGIPSVLLETVIAQNKSIAGGGGTATFDVTPYASLEISIASGVHLLAEQIDPTGLVVESALISAQTRYAIRAGTIRFTNNTAGPVLLTLTASNRQLQNRIDTRLSPEYGDQWSAAIVAGGTTVLAQLAAGVRLQGGVMMDASVSGTTCLGRFVLVGPTFNIVLADTAEMYTSAGGGARHIRALAAVPAADYTIQFVCVTLGSGGTATISLIPTEL